MPYQIVRTLTYRSCPELGFFIPFLHSGFINFSTDIQPYYPDLTSETYSLEISNMIPLWGNLDSMAQFFNNTNGIESYNYTFIDPDYRVNGVIQTIVYKDISAYNQWQDNENNRANNSMGKIAFNLGENGSFDASTFILDGIVKTDTASGISKELTLGQFLVTKFNILRNTLCSNVHSIV